MEEFRLARQSMTSAQRHILDRDVMLIISDGFIPDREADGESPYVTMVRDERVDGTDALRRMQGLLETDERELLV